MYNLSYPLCRNLNEIGPVVSEEKLLENVDRQLTCDLRPRSPKDLDIKSFIVVEFECTVVLKRTKATKECTFSTLSNQQPMGPKLTLT